MTKLKYQVRGQSQGVFLPPTLTLPLKGGRDMTVGAPFSYTL